MSNSIAVGGRFGDCQNSAMKGLETSWKLISEFDRSYVFLKHNDQVGETYFHRSTLCHVETSVVIV